jgi:hypothetical protein
LLKRPFLLFWFPFPLGKKLLPIVRFPFPRGKRLLPIVRFPFPLGKGLGVRFFGSSAMRATIPVPLPTMGKG